MSLRSKVAEYAKKHTFHFIVIIFIALAIASHVSQYAIITRLDHKIDDNHSETLRMIQNTEEDILANVEVKDTAIQNDLSSFRASIQSRVDTIDSTIDPELKRRALVKTVRDAITENTDRKIGIRSLNRIANAVIDYSYEQNLSIAIILAQMKQESDFEQTAKSHAHAKGLMQILDHPQRSTADEIAGELGYRGYNIWDIRVNVRFGAFYMRKMLTAFNNNYEDALRAYNFGPHHVLEVKAGDRDYSRSKVIIEDGVEVQYLVDKYGELELDENGEKIQVQEKDKYPRETRNYVKRVKKYRAIFAKYGLDKVE